MSPLDFRGQEPQAFGLFSFTKSISPHYFGWCFTICLTIYSVNSTTIRSTSALFNVWSCSTVPGRGTDQHFTGWMDAWMLEFPWEREVGTWKEDIQRAIDAWEHPVPVIWAPQVGPAVTSYLSPVPNVCQGTLHVVTHSIPVTTLWRKADCRGHFARDDTEVWRG